MLEFAFCIDTGDAKSVCFRQSTYTIHKGEIMTEHISQLENNNLIRDCAEPWSALLLLAAKPHQESCIDINTYIWRLCITYCPLTSVTRSFEFLILRCSDSIEDLGDSYGNLFSISLNARSSYHHIKVRPCDQEKLAFFTPNSKNKCFVVILFGPKNVPAIYTAMMRIL